MRVDHREEGQIVRKTTQEGWGGQLGTYLDRRVELKVLSGRERLEQRVELGAVPHQPVNRLRVLPYVEAAQVSRPRRGRQLPCSKLERDRKLVVDP